MTFAVLIVFAELMTINPTWMLPNIIEYALQIMNSTKINALIYFTYWIA